jgi:hypothetical protein
MSEFFFLFFSLLPFLLLQFSFSCIFPVLSLLEEYSVSSITGSNCCDHDCEGIADALYANIGRSRGIVQRNEDPL